MDDGAQPAAHLGCPATTAGRLRRLLRQHLRHLLVASRAPRQRHALAAVPPVAPRAATHRGIHLLLQASDRDGLQLAAGQLRRLRGDGHQHRGRRLLHHVRRARRDVLPLEPAHPARPRLPVPAPGDAPHPPPARPPRVQLQRLPDLGHVVRHLREPPPHRRAAGFAGDKEQQFVDMLLFRDVHSLPGKTQPAPVLVKPDVR
ncbi:putative desaturase [Pseudomonas aeruginosa PA38182]|nr:putative desaturase [Pseudomonas aeruginosa PA38182]